MEKGQFGDSLDAVVVIHEKYSISDSFLGVVLDHAAGILGSEARDELQIRSSP
jgi:hypothetical protein